MNKMNWDDIRYVLAVSREGSLNSAASKLGVTHATVLRRVAAFEQRYGLRIFEKSQAGYQPLVEAQEIFRAIEAVETAALRLERVTTGTEQSPSGLVRIASTDSLSQIVLPKLVKVITKRFPKISISVLSGNSHHDLTRLSADIVIRPTAKLSEGLVGRRVGQLDFGIYATNATIQNWLTLRGALKRSKPALWMAANLDLKQVTMGADSFIVLKELVALGLGKSFLPTLVADKDERLVRISSDDPKISVPIHVATLEEVAETPRFKLVQDTLVELLSNSIDQPALASD